MHTEDQLPGARSRIAIIVALAVVIVTVSLWRPSLDDADALRAGDGAELITDTDPASAEPADVPPVLAADRPQPEAVNAAALSDDADLDGPGVLVVADATEPDPVIAACEPADSTDSAEATWDPSLEPTAEAALAAWYSSSFNDETAADWSPLSGTWVMDEAGYHQQDPGGYDLISRLIVDPPAAYRVGVSMVAEGESLGGGILLAQAIPDTRANARMVDFTDGGRFLRWGGYDETGRYRFDGGVAMPDDFDPQASHRLEVEVRPERTIVFVDDREIGTFEPVTDGRLGLVTSVSSVLFRNFEIVELGA